MEEVVPKRREYVNKIKKEYGDRSLGNVTVDMVLYFFTSFSNSVTCVLLRRTMECVASRD